MTTSSPWDIYKPEQHDSLESVAFWTPPTRNQSAQTTVPELSQHEKNNSIITTTAAPFTMPASAASPVILKSSLLQKARKLKHNYAIKHICSVHSNTHISHLSMNLVDLKMGLFLSIRKPKGNPWPELLTPPIKPETFSATLQTFIEICETTAFYHDREIIHGDLKPDHIIIGEFGEVVISGWQIAAVAMTIPVNLPSAGLPSGTQPSTVHCIGCILPGWHSSLARNRPSTPWPRKCPKRHPSSPSQCTINTK